jgi:hypothetical protein
MTINDITLRRQTIQMASQLPDEYDGSIAVLEYARALAAFSAGKTGVSFGANPTATRTKAGQLAAP